MVNEPPVVATLAGDAATYTEGLGAVLLDVGSNATITDADSSNFDGGRLTVGIAVPAGDVLTIVSQGTGAGQVGTSGSQVSFGGMVIGNFSGGSSGEALTVFFNANATPIAVQALVRGIAYNNSDVDNPTPGTRTVHWFLVDGDGTANGGDQDVSFTSTVPVVAVDDAPVARPDAVTAAEDVFGTGSVFSNNGSGADSDVDGPALIVAALNGSAAGVRTQITLASGATLTLNANGSYSYYANNQFAYLMSPATAAATGAVNTSAVDSFTYTLAGGGNTVTVTMTVGGIDGEGDELRGTAGDDVYVVDQAGNIVVRAPAAEPIASMPRGLMPLAPASKSSSWPPEAPILLRRSAWPATSVPTTSGATTATTRCMAWAATTPFWASAATTHWTAV